jgi:dTDP-4-amino-4,6-dideoxygalactose transaminase
MIKFLDIYQQDKNLHKEIFFKIKKLFKNGDFILGSEVKKFEAQFSKFTDSKYSIGCANGTDAITIALKSLNLKAGSEVIIPAMTYCSTAFAVINANLKPILADINHLEPTISLFEIKKKISNKTKVIIPVHLYGSSADIRGIRNIIGKKKIYIIDDCAQAHGARDNNGNKIGSISDISTFSLYPGKNLGAYGDAGIITTNNKYFYNKIKKIRNLGSIKKFKHDEIGVNSRLDTIQAIILNKKIKKLNFLNNKRKKIANFYKTKIKNPKIVKLNYSKYCVYHQYVVLVKNKKNFLII